MTRSADAGPRHPSSRVRRIVALVALAVVIAVGLGVHSLLPNTAATDIAADALYAVAVYLALVVVVPRWPAVGIGALAAGWCVAVELFQLTGLPLAVGARFPPAMLVLGTVFETRDLVVYLLTVALVIAVDMAASKLAVRRAT